MELAEITAALAAKPELKTGLIGALREDVLTVLKADGVYRTKEEEETFLSNYEKTVIPSKVDAQIGDRIRETYNRIDKDIEEVTGLKKGPHEKTYDFNKRVLAKLKADAAAGNGGGDEVLRQQLEAAQKELEQRKDYVPKSELEKIQSQYFTKEVNSRIQAALGRHQIAAPAHITDDAAKKQYTDAQTRFISADFLSRFTAKQDAEGNLTFFEGDKLLTDSKTAKPLTEAEIIEKHYGAYFIPAKQPGKGAGSGSGSGGDSDPVEADLKTKADVNEYLTKKGLVVGDRKYNDEYKRILAEQGITK